MPRIIEALRNETRVSAVSSGAGVTVSCIWYPDLDRAVELITAAAREDLLWGEPQIEYRYGTMRRGAGSVEVRLEPILTVEVTTPAVFIGNVIGDLMSRRGLMKGQRSDGDQTLTVWAEVPLAELRDYPALLLRAADASARASAEFHSYAPAPPSDGPFDEPMSAALRA